MTSVQGCGYLCWERLFVTPPESSLFPKSEFFKQFAGSLEPKFLATTTDVLKYFKNDLQWIFKTILEAQAPAPAPTPAISEES